jgi:hypothetical protein
MNKKKDTIMFEELIFCVDCRYNGYFGKCENPLFSYVENTPYKPYTVFSSMDYVNKNNDCKEFLKREVIIEYTFFEKIFNKLKNLFNK